MHANKKIFTNTHADTHKYTYTYSLAHAHTHAMHAQIHRYKYTHTYSQMHSHTQKSKHYIRATLVRTQGKFKYFVLFQFLVVCEQQGCICTRDRSCCGFQ
uniref:Uncharacterized protein n=1 Tax=Anguilla anguilla TaxID=7936 RepID=A0A0E9WZU3_ANGAN